jgi:selenocysteine lyase/cysteine desulfurase
MAWSQFMNDEPVLDEIASLINALEIDGHELGLSASKGEMTYKMSQEMVTVIEQFRLKKTNMKKCKNKKKDKVSWGRGQQDGIAMMQKAIDLKKKESEKLQRQFFCMS